MDRLGVLLVLAFVLHSVSSQLASSGGSSVNIGDQNKTLNCRAKDFDFLTESLQWVKLDSQNPTGDSSRSLSEGINVNSRYVHNYSIDAHPYDAGVNFILTIKGIQKSDDGFYKCIRKTGKNIFIAESQRQEIKVRQPIASLVLMVGSFKVKPGDSPKTFELEQFDKDLVVQCKVRGSNPEPKVQLSVGEEDISQQVLRQDEDNFQGPMFDAARTYNTDLDSTAKKTFDRSILGKEITCAGWTKEDESDKISATAILTVKEPPKVECNNVTTRLGDRYVKLTCVIESLQRPEKITWYVDNTKTPLFVPTTEAHLEGYKASQKELGENKVETTLEIYQIEEKHFKNKYMLKAQVAPNRISHEVRLHQKPNTDESTGGVGAVSMTTTLLVSVVMIGAVLRRWM